MSNISIKNISTAKVILVVPDFHFRRELGPKRSIPVTEEIYNELIFDPGFNGLINDHYIVVTGIAEEDQPTILANPPVESSEIERMMKEQDVTAFAKFIPKAAQAERDAVVELAIKNGVTTPAFVSLIKKYCDVDIIQAINIKHLSEE